MFERNWNEFVMKHGLERNEWLSKLYVDREYWVPIYLNHTFCAGMVSTQRSESMHAYFEGYVNSMSTLKQFVEQYEIAMCDEIEKEFYADFKSKNINDGMIAPTSNAQATIDTNNVDENEENERVILNPHVTCSRGRSRINRHRSVREITQRANSSRNRNSEKGRRRGRPRNNINLNIAEQVGLHNSQTPGSQTQGNVIDAVINPIVSGTIPSHRSIRH
ncbi:hypothetical protein GH714_029874 [Hevea brasiliensis]|uniref:Protein FAR1-RELATED SEQUENCE n=1 Tax=Hevea brasiliensis TaxID=3981 RepID=A0A6A6L0U5_HEVBR|nr:hypothetical protein GH714_029874 [Hevea brasiliensis]